MLTCSSIARFRDESVGAVKRGRLESREVPSENVLLYEMKVGDEFFSGIRVFPRLARVVSFFSLKERELQEEVGEAWKTVREFLKGSSPEAPPCYFPEKLTLVYGFTDFPYSYSAVFSAFGTFTFVEAETEEVVNFGLPVRDLKGKDLSVSVQLFPVPRHSFLSLRLLNLI